jgi:thiamine biosynthesis lipoprotein
MGTVLTLEVEAPARRSAVEASERAVRALEQTEARLSTWTENSELSRLNRQPPGEPMLLSVELADDLGRAKACWQATSGAFDPGVGALVGAWNLRGGGALPSPEELQAALAVGGLRALTLAARHATRQNEGLIIEEGAFGKGIGLDAATSALVQSGVSRAVIELGGEVAVVGGPAPFVLEVADPSKRSRRVLGVSIAGGALATSGNSERGIVVDGVEQGHLLDPRTGTPAPDFGSLSVWAPDATTADCLSTGLYVMGPEKALHWAARHAEIEVLVLQRDDAKGLRARFTAGFGGRLIPLDPDLRLEPFVLSGSDRGPTKDDSGSYEYSTSTLH